LKDKFLPFLILGALSLIWGSSFILIKKGLIAFSPLEVGALRIFFAYIVALPLAIKYIPKFFKENWKKLFLYGMLTNLIPAILFANAETGLSSSLTGILNSITPIFTLIIGALFFATKIKSKQLLGLFVSFIGSAILSTVGGDGQLGSFNYYALFVVAAAICYGYTANMVKVHFKNMHSLAITSIALFTVGPLTFFYLIFSEVPNKLLQGSEASILSLIYIFILGAFGTTFALILFNKLIHLTTAVFATTITYIIPVMAVIWGVIDGESIFAFHFAGMLLVILGVYLINKFK